MVNNILIFSAHDDDDVMMTGTILKYIKEGKNIIEVVFSKGQMSHPHLKEDVIAKERKKEAEKVAEKIGFKEIIFLNLKDAKLKKEIEEKNILEKVERIIKKYKPSKIFTLTKTDTHADHRAVNNVVMKAVDNLKEKYDVYTFKVWNLISESKAKMYVNIDKYFDGKIEIMKMYKSQKHFIYLLLVPVYVSNFLDGIRNNCKYAECFYKER